MILSGINSYINETFLFSYFKFTLPFQRQSVAKIAQSFLLDTYRSIIKSNERKGS